MSFEVIIVDFGVVAALTALEQMPSGLEPAAKEVNELLLKEVRAYPPERPNQQYQRTGDLGASWESIVHLKGYKIAEVKSRAVRRRGKGGRFLKSYNELVMGAEKQAAVHKGRWKTTADIAKEQETAVAEIFDKQVQELIDRVGR